MRHYGIRMLNKTSSYISPLQLCDPCALTRRLLCPPSFADFGAHIQTSFYKASATNPTDDPSHAFVLTSHALALHRPNLCLINCHSKVKLLRLYLARLATCTLNTPEYYMNSKKDLHLSLSMRSRDCTYGCYTPWHDRQRPAPQCGRCSSRLSQVLAHWQPHAILVRGRAAAAAAEGCLREW